MMEFESKSMLSGMVMAVLLAIALADTSTIPTTTSPASTPSTTTPLTTTTLLTRTTTTDYLGMFPINDSSVCEICNSEFITLCNVWGDCTAIFQCESIGVEDFEHCNPYGDMLACSQTGSSSLPGLAGLVKDLLEEQRKKLKKFWPCFKGVLSGIKTVFINADRCGYGSAWDSSTSSQIDLMQEMRDMFKSRKCRVTQILTHISDKMNESPFSYLYPKGHLAVTLARMAEALHAMTNDELRKMLGRKCFNRLSKRCI